MEDLFVFYCRNPIKVTSRQLKEKEVENITEKIWAEPAWLVTQRTPLVGLVMRRFLCLSLLAGWGKEVVGRRSQPVEVIFSSYYQRSAPQA
jgi:hypothetical protein